MEILNYNNIIQEGISRSGYIQVEVIRALSNNAKIKSKEKHFIKILIRYEEFIRIRLVLILINRYTRNKRRLDVQ